MNDFIFYKRRGFSALIGDTFTFFKKYDLNGKTIIPFTTHEGSGLANVVEDLKSLYPKATITGAFAIYGHEVRSGKAKVEKWLESMGY